MQQRSLRLGDILDDYCPRERRITNHAVVAMIDDQVKQTRCTTCEAEHEYKAAKTPVKRKTKRDSEPVGVPEAAMMSTEDEQVEVLSSEVDGDVESEGMKKVGQESAVRRPLIRAVLPRVEGQVQVRRPPEFTVPQGAGFKSDSRNGNSNHKTLKSGKQAGHQGSGDNGLENGSGSTRVENVQLEGVGPFGTERVIQNKETRF